MLSLSKHEVNQTGGLRAARFRFEKTYRPDGIFLFFVFFDLLAGFWILEIPWIARLFMSGADHGPVKTYPKVKFLFENRCAPKLADDSEFSALVSTGSRERDGVPFASWPPGEAAIHRGERPRAEIPAVQILLRPWTRTRWVAGSSPAMTRLG
jgi:hypothetical protein